MKKYFLLVVLSFALILAIISCKKNVNTEYPDNPDQSTVEAATNPVEAKILSFKNSMQNPLKIERVYSIDSAVWYSEALVNYTYADVRNNQQDISFDSSFINVPLSNGKVSLSDLSSLYGKIVDSLAQQNHTLPSSGHLLVCDVFTRPNDSTANQVTFRVYSSFTYGPQIISGPFGEEDWWRYGGRENNNGGYCDSSIYAGTHTYDDAARQIARKIRLVAPGQRHTTTDVIGLEVIADGTIFVNSGGSYDCVFNNPGDTLPFGIHNDNYFDFLMFNNYHSDHFTNYHECLSPDEMNFYLQGTNEVFYTVLYDNDCIGGVINGKNFITINNMWGDMTVNSGENYWIGHIATVEYGIWVLNNNEPQIFE